MESKILCLLLAILHIGFSAKYDANIPKTVDSLSKIRTIAPKMLLQKNYSEKFVKDEIAKVAAGIELYKKKLKNQQLKRAKMEKKLLIPHKCKKINCPLEEKPICAKFFFKNSTRKPFYVRLLNECEMNYMKCHRGLQSTLVSMDNCHSIIDNLQISTQTETEKKRSKRAVNAEPPPKIIPKDKVALKSNKITNPKSASKVKPPESNKNPAKTKLAESVKSTKLSHKNVPGSLKTNNKAGPKVKTSAVIDKTKLAVRNELNSKKADNTPITESKANPKIVAKGIITNKNKTVIKLAANKNAPNEKVKLKSAVATNSTPKQPTKTKTKPGTKLLKLKSANSKVKSVPKPGKTVLKSGSKAKPNVGQKKIGIKGAVKNIKKRSVKKSLREDKEIKKEYLEKNRGNDKMFKYNVFSKARSKQKPKKHINAVQRQSGNGKQYFKKNLSKNKMFNNNVFSSKQRLKGYANKIEQPVVYGLPNGNKKLVEEIEITMELDTDFSSEIPKHKNIQLNMEDSSDFGENGGSVIIEDDISDSNLVEQPSAGGSDAFNEEEEYNYQPDVVPPIVALDVDEDEKEGNPDQSISTEKVSSSEEDRQINNKNPMNEDSDSSEMVIGNSGGQNDNQYQNNDYDAKDGQGGQSVDSDSGGTKDRNISTTDDEDEPKPKLPFLEKHKHTESVNMEEYQADCPTQCPARDLMVCAVCQHGVYRTFLSVCHMRMYKCKVNQEEELTLVSRLPCVMSAPIITSSPEMRPVGRLTEPGDEDRVLRYIRCREKRMLGKNPRCTFDDDEEKEAQKVMQTEDVKYVNISEY